MGGLLRGALNKLKGWVLGNEVKQTEHFAPPASAAASPDKPEWADSSTELFDRLKAARARNEAARHPDAKPVEAPATTPPAVAAKVEPATPPASQFNTTGQKPIIVTTKAEADAVRQSSAAIARTLPEGAAPRASVDKFTAQSLAVLDSPQGANFGREVLLDASRILQKHTPDDPAAALQLQVVMRLSHSKQIDAIVKREVQMSGLHGAKAAQLAADNLEDVRLILGTSSAPKATMDALTALERNLDVLRAHDPRAAAKKLEGITAVLAPRTQMPNSLTPAANQRFDNILMDHNDDMSARGHANLGAGSMGKLARDLVGAPTALPNNSVAFMVKAEQHRLHRPITTQSVPQKPDDVNLDFTKPAAAAKPAAPVPADNNLDFTYIAAQKPARIGDDMIDVPASFGKPATPSFADIATSRPVSAQKPPPVEDVGSPSVLPREGSIGGARSRHEDPTEYIVPDLKLDGSHYGSAFMSDAAFDAAIAKAAADEAARAKDEAARALRSATTKGPGL